MSEAKEKLYQPKLNLMVTCPECDNEIENDALGIGKQMEREAECDWCNKKVLIPKIWVQETPTT